MSIKSMHYDFKKKLNKVDSQQYRNFQVPEIDWALNEAMRVFIDMVAEPRIQTMLGFEKNQKSIDDIRTIVVEDYCSSIITNNTITIPEDYLYYIKGFAITNRGKCEGKKLRLKIQQHNDEFEENSFFKSSFGWRSINATFYENGIRIYPADFNVDKVCLSYIKNPKFMHNAEDYRGGQYKLLDGTLLTGTQDCELPVQTHREIVDLAVMMTSGEIGVPSYNIHMAKVSMDKLQ